MVDTDSARQRKQKRKKGGGGVVAQLLPQIDLAAVAQPDSHKTEEEAWLDAVESGNLQVIGPAPCLTWIGLNVCP